MLVERELVQTVNDDLDEIIAEKPDEHVRQIAYDIWKEEGEPDGRADEHWREAKRRAKGTQVQQ